MGIKVFQGTFNFIQNMTLDSVGIPRHPGLLLLTLYYPEAQG